MKIGTIFYPVIMLAAICCGSQERSKTIVTKRSTRELVSDTGKLNSKDTNRLTYEAFVNRKGLVITNLYKDTDTAFFFNEKIGMQCENWKLDTADILNIFKRCEAISGEEWHHDYDVMPCSYKGQLVVDGKKADFSVNAGAAVSITLKDTSIALGYKLKDYKKYFLQGKASPADFED